MKRKTVKWIRHTHILRRDDFECPACGFLADRPYSVCPRCSVSSEHTEYDPSWVDELEIMDEIVGD